MPAASGVVVFGVGLLFFARERVVFLLAIGGWDDSVESVPPDHDGPEGETHEYSLLRGRALEWTSGLATNDLTHGSRRQAD